MFAVQCSMGVGQIQSSLEILKVGSPGIRVNGKFYGIVVELLIDSFTQEVGNGVAARRTEG